MVLDAKMAAVVAKYHRDFRKVSALRVVERGPYATERGRLAVTCVQREQSATHACCRMPRAAWFARHEGGGR